MDAGGEELVKFIECAAKGLCNHPAEVKVEGIFSKGQSLCLVVYCNPDDVSLIIGREGRNIRAIRELSWAIATKNRIKITIIINE